MQAVTTAVQSRCAPWRAWPQSPAGIPDRALSVANARILLATSELGAALDRSSFDDPPVTAQEPSVPDLRALLDEMTADVTALPTHAASLLAIAEIHPHSIVELPLPHGEPASEFNCVMHALDLVARMEEPCRPLGRFYADTGFLQWLIDTKVVATSSPVVGALVTWASNGQIRHVGTILTAERAVSKWGIGNLYSHGLLEVPSAYGDELAFYSPLGWEDGIARLTEYIGLRR